MSRSIWKNVYIDSSLFSSAQNSSIELVQTNSRESTVVHELNRKSIGIYNGKQYFVVRIYPAMFGYKLGEFVQTKKICVYKKTKKAIKKYVTKK